jgi:tetratricopeptide (TPR) repeat protein
MNLRLTAIFLTFLLYSSSCTVYKEYPIEIYKPQELALSDSAKSAALVFRNFRYSADTLMHYYKKDNQLVKVNNDPSDLDSLQAITCLNELALKLKNENIFDKILVLPFLEKHTEDKLSPLPSNLVRQLASDAVADILISLETFSSFYSLWPEIGEVPAKSEVVTVAIWGLYNGATGVQTDRRTMIDTIYWNGYDIIGQPIINYRIPPRVDGILLASAMAGESYAAKFYPGWQTVNRMYSIPPLPDFSEAAYFFEEGKWDEAMMIWEKYAEKRNGKMAINARYNLALACEMQDDLSSAQKWLASAMELAKSYRSTSDQKIISSYQNILYKRQKDILTLEE